MIYVFGNNETLTQDLKRKYKGQTKQIRFVNSDYFSNIDNLYKNNGKNVYGIVASGDVEGVPGDMWIDLLEGLAKRIPVLVTADEGNSKLIARLNQTFRVTWVLHDDVDHVARFLDSCGALTRDQRVASEGDIPLLNMQVAARILEKNGYLCILSIHGVDFRKVALEYGSDVYNKLQFVLRKILFEIWGESGSFRRSDILCRRTPKGNTFYLLLDRGRSETHMPSPGSLERLADRLSVRLENLMWQELFSASNQRVLPRFLEIVPRFVVGYASAVDNPCVERLTTVENLFRTCRVTADIQDDRMVNRQRELIQTLIQAGNLIFAHFQGVFDLRQFSDKHMETLASLSGTKKKTNETIDLEKKRLQTVADTIYAFESLARVNKDDLSKIVGEDLSLNLDFLNPNVLFARAAEVNLKLELDQACFRLAMEAFFDLPGKLLVNILPRNFYYLDQLKHLIDKKNKIIFEVSESEAINNMSLLLEIKDKLDREQFGIAIDDFGSGYAGLDRIIKSQPDIIKLDRSLITAIDKDPQMQMFVKGLVDAGRSTNSLLLAEGVETVEELQILRELGIDLVQGFFLHRPMSRDNIQKTLGKPKKTKK